MIALDTNVIVRVLANDDPEQVETALEVMESDVLWLPKTVLLETEWVLRFTYGQSREAIAKGLSQILGLENAVVEDREAVLDALAWFSDGMDFADAMHLASSRRAEEFLTFDRQLASAQSRVNAKPSVHLL